MKKFKKILVLGLSLMMALTTGCAATEPTSVDAAETVTKEVSTTEEKVFVYGSGDYTSINPAIYEHGEINSL
ncbi:MAG: ABC transporter substrate-binding protein, partial [Cellulosilyticaceae bacterium]